MAQQLKNILHFSLPSGGSQTLPHGLNIQNGQPVIPDHLEPSAPGFSFDVDDINVTATGVGDVDVLVEYWHSIERAFGSSGVTALSPRPFIPDDPSETPTPPFALVTTTIYARITGNDHNGKGTLAKPYRTFQRAIRDVPNIPGPGQRFIVDVTGIGVEQFPFSYCLPAISFPALDYDNDTSIPYFYSGAGLRVRALPRLASTISAYDAVINNTAGAVISADPDTNLITLTISSPRASWTPAHLRNKQIIRTVGSHFAGCVIVDVTPTTLTLTNNANNFNGAVQGGPGVGPLFLAPGEVLQIVEPSATFQADPNSPAVDDFADTFVGILSTVNSIAFQGIKVTQPGSGFPVALGSMNCPNAPFELCDLEGLYGLGSTGTYWCYPSGCVMRANVFSSLMHIAPPETALMHLMRPRPPHYFLRKKKKFG